MGIAEYSSQDELDDAFEAAMERAGEKEHLLDLIEEAQYRIEEAESDLKVRQEELADLEQRLASFDD